MQSLVLSVLLCGAVPSHVAVVCPVEWRETLAPWVAHREAQGYRPVFLSNQRTAAEIRDEIVRLAEPGTLRAVVLIGDADSVVESDGAPGRLSTPTHYIPARVNVRWGSEPEIATDNPYGDLDGDSIPDVPVGRLSVRSAEELQIVVRKILEYERSADRGTWCRQINLVAGVGGFSPLVDSILEMATKKFLTDGIPDGYETTMTYASWQSPYCPDPRRFRAAALERINEGCLFWVYIGHGHPYRLDAVRVPGAEYPILSAPDIAQMQARRGLPIALMLACYTGAMDAPRDCLAEAMLRQPRGPIAVIGGSRVTMPYAMAVLSNALMAEVFRSRAETLGEAFCRAKRTMVAIGPDDPNRQLLDALAAAVSPMPDRLADERQEHLALFNLLGDPLLAIPRAVDVQVDVPDSITAGETLTVQGRSATGGAGVVEIVSRRDRLRHEIPARRQFDFSDEFLNSFDSAYKQANDRIWTSRTFEAGDEAFALPVELPLETRGPCYVRVWIQGPHQTAQGAARVFVHRGPATAGAE